MIFNTIVVGPLEVNCYILGCDNTKEVFIIDPGDNLKNIVKTIETENWIPRAIVNTHGHIDHAGGVKALMDKLKIPFYLHTDELPVIHALKDQGDRFGLYFSGIPDPIAPLSDGQTLTIGEETVSVYHTPGHSPGGICLLCRDHLICGDTLFAGSIGRTDLPGGNYDILMNSIQKKLLVLDPDIRVFPGHGPASTLGREARYNPFLNGSY